MRVIVLGGTGHIGSYLVPRLVDAGYEVISVSRQERSPYQNYASCAHQNNSVEVFVHYGHNRRIYDNLQIQRRTEAVARARELGLL